MNEVKMESMLAQLIKMVGSLQSDMQEMKKEQQEVKREQQEIKKEQQKLETKSDHRHQEILEHFKNLERDQDFIWEKTARNERDIGNIKRQLS